MDLWFSHRFAEHDSRLDDLLASLRHERKHGQGRVARGLASRAVSEVERLRNQSRPLVPWGKRTRDDVLDAFARTPYERLMATIQRARHPFNPIIDAIEAARHAVEDRRVVQSLLALHATHAARIASQCALLAWAWVIGHWRQLFAWAAVRFPIRRADGFFGSDKVDGRNIP